MITCVSVLGEAIGVHLLTGVEHTRADLEGSANSVLDLDVRFSSTRVPALIVVAEQEDESTWPPWTAAVAPRAANPMLLAIVTPSADVCRAINAATWLVSTRYTVFATDSFNAAVEWVAGKRGCEVPGFEGLLSRAREMAAGRARPDDAGFESR